MSACLFASERIRNVHVVLGERVQINSF